MTNEHTAGMDTHALYREESFTDRKMGTLQRLVPVDSAGRDDPSRPTIYVGQAQMMTPMGALPLSFEIEADSLEAAANKFGEAAQEAAQKTIEELKELRREAASSIIVPEAGGGGLGAPGGGKIQLR